VHVQTDPRANLGHGRFLPCGCGDAAQVSAARLHNSPTIARGTRQLPPASPDGLMHGGHLHMV
jgi:hypothetical protein